MHYNADFRGALHAECRVKGCMMHRIQNPEVCFVQGAEFRDVIHTEYRV